MKKNQIQHDMPPYSDTATKLLESIFKALHLLCTLENSSNVLSEKVDKNIYDCFKWINDKGGYPRSKGKNSHITEGFPRDLKSQPKKSVRIVRLIKQAWSNSIEEASRSEKDKKVFLPSPLKILYDILTIPEQPQSRAYALVTCRNILFENFKVYPESEKKPVNNLEMENKSEDWLWEIFSLEELTRVYSEIKTYPSHRDNYSKPRTFKIEYSRTKLFLAHYLAMKGVLYLKFGIDAKKKAIERVTAYELRKRYCAEKNLIGSEDLIYEFRRSQNYMDFPALSQITNQIWGIPLPIQNADTVFNGAMKFSSSGSLIISVHGKAGTGKTSFALAAAASLAALGTNTYYISFEEEQKDLRVRLHSLIPLYLRKLSFFNKDTNKWFFTSKPDIFASDDSQLMEKFTKDHLLAIKRVIDNTENQIELKGIPNPCPLLVVVDGVSVLCSDKGNIDGYKALHNFIKACKSLNVMVILLSGENNSALETMDYLVDTVIKLNYLGTDKAKEKPVRILQLIKTRQQVSRPGSHIFHMSGGKGFRIDPQLPSQLDKQQIMAKHMPDENQIINQLTGNVKSKQGELFGKKRFLDLYAGSQILLHGHGSGGKAGLGLKILGTPLERKTNKDDEVITPAVNDERRKVLIVSFLYEDVYYKNLLRKMGPKGGSARIETLCFYPGFLTPENFLSKILRKLNAGVLQGEPFTGVLLDGLHNVFLQFPVLADNTMVWPMIYNMLARSKVTTVTTFTTFSFLFTHSVKETATKSYDEMLIEGHKPFLHALVQATDFYLMLERETEKDKTGQDIINYELTVKEAIRQKLPKGSLIWDRENLVFE